MKCPYCGAEVVSRRCIYCDSDLLDFIRKNGLDLADFAEPESVKVPDEEMKEKKEVRSPEEVLADIRSLCLDLLNKYPDTFCAYDKNGTIIGGTAVKKRLIELLKIPAGEEIFLIHDDTMMHSGKNGFAITDHGFYCRKLWENTTFVSYEELPGEEIRPEEITIMDDASIYIRDPKTTVAYCSGNKQLSKELKNLILNIFQPQ